MKKILSLLLTALMILSLAACGSQKQEETTEEGFQPSLDTSTSCHINVAGGYDNFEALETEIDRFNKFYPNVELVGQILSYGNMLEVISPLPFRKRVQDETKLIIERYNNEVKE